jgi:hypothetical protein
MTGKNSTNAAQAATTGVDAGAVNSRHDFVEFLRGLGRDFRDHADAWENGDLSSFLDAMAAWIEDMDGYYEAHGEPVPTQPTWKVLAQVFAAARVYE